MRRRVDEIAAQDAEDLVHDVVVQLFGMADITVPIEHLSAYVYCALQNRITDHFRKRKKISERRTDATEQEIQSLSELVEQSGYHSAPEIRRMEIAHDLFRFLEQLNEQERELIIENDINGRTMGDLSTAWGIPVNTLLSRKSRALKKIQQHIQSKQIEQE